MSTTINMDGRFKIADYGGVAFYLDGYAKEWSEEDEEEIEDRSMVRAIMVGDDYVHVVDVDCLTEIEDDEYCSGCGQIGCGWG